MRRLVSRSRGAGIVEYAVIVVAVLLIAAGSYKMLGGQLAKRGSGAGDVVSGGDDHGSGRSPGGSGGGSGGKSGGGSGGDGRVAGKASVAGAGGGNYESGGAGGARDTSDGSGAKNAPASISGGGGGANVDEGFNSKRWMGIGLLAAGVIALLYVLMTMRGTKKMGDALGPQKSGKAKRA